MEDRLVAGSREVAKNFNKKHYNLVRDIENLIKKNPLTFEGLDYFIETMFEHRGNEYKEYLLTRDGLSLLVMGYTGTKALDWKIKYISAFNKLEKIALENQPHKIEGLKETQLLEANEKIKELENNLIISYQEAKSIKQLASDRVESILKASILTGPKVYGRLWQAYRKRFGVSSYHNTLKKDLEDVEKFIQDWTYGKGDIDG